MPRYAQTSAIQRFAALDRRLRAPFVSVDGDLPLPKPVKGAGFSCRGLPTAPRKRQESGECRLGSYEIYNNHVFSEETITLEALQAHTVETPESGRYVRS